MRFDNDLSDGVVDAIDDAVQDALESVEQDAAGAGVPDTEK